MPWLNWSLKLHIRLRTISYLVSTHITHVYVQWMPYSFVWLYSIKWVAHAQSYVDQTQKDFWVFLVVFGKCFCFEKIQKIQKICATLFWWLTRGSSQSRVTQMLLWLPGEPVPQSWKRFRKISKILGFWVCLNLN